MSKRVMQLSLVLVILLTAAWPANADISFAETVVASGIKRTTLTISTPQAISGSLVVPSTVTLSVCTVCAMLHSS